MSHGTVPISAKSFMQTFQSYLSTSFLVFSSTPPTGSCGPVSNLCSICYLIFKPRVLPISILALFLLCLKYLFLFDVLLSFLDLLPTLISPFLFSGLLNIFFIDLVTTFHIRRSQIGHLRHFRHYQMPSIIPIY